MTTEEFNLEVIGSDNQLKKLYAEYLRKKLLYDISSIDNALEASKGAIPKEEKKKLPPETF
jgi:hypothetical protein